MGLFPLSTVIQSGWPVTLPKLPGATTQILGPTTSSRFPSIHVPAPTKSFTFLEGHRNQILKLDVSPSPVLIVPPTTTQSRLRPCEIPSSGLTTRSITGTRRSPRPLPGDQLSLRLSPWTGVITSSWRDHLGPQRPRRAQL